MEIKINSIRLDVSLLVPSGLLLFGFIFLGRYLRILQIDNGFRAIWFAIPLIMLTTILVLPINLGGLVAAILGISVVFWKFGILPGIVSLAITITYILLSLDNVSRQKQIPILKWQEWLAALGTVAITLGLSLAIARSLPTWISSISIGIVAGAIATIGTQLKQAELTIRQTAIGLGGLTLIGLMIGLIHASFTYLPKAAT
jgi:hypothetical protein